MKASSSALTVTGVLNASKTWIEHVTFSKKGNYIAACSHTTIHVFNLSNKFQNEKCEFQLEHRDTVWKSVFSQDDEILFSSCADGCMYAWNVRSHELLYTVEVEPEKRSLFGITVSPNDQQALLSSVVGSINVVCLRSKEILASINGHNESIEDICYSLSGILVASCAKDDETLLISTSADKTVKLWSVASCECLKTFYGHKGVVWSARFVDKEATSIVSCSSDGTIRLWGVEAGKVLEKLRNPGSYNYHQGCPRDQLFWCAVNHQAENIAIGSYHGNIYFANIAFTVLDQKNKVKIGMAKRQTDVRRHEVAIQIVRDSLNKALKILHEA